MKVCQAIFVGGEKKKDAGVLKRVGPWCYYDDAFSHAEWAAHWRAPK